MKPVDPIQEVFTRYREYALIQSISGLAGWDQHTYMPPKGGEYRAEQLAFLAKLGHARLTHPSMEELLSAIPEDLDDTPEAANIREIRRTHARATKLPARLVEEIAKVTSQAQNVWAEARAKNDFDQFAPWLDKIVVLKREEAAAVGFQESPYDALLDEYEPGAKASDITAVFTQLRDALAPMVATIVDSNNRPRKDILTREFAIDRQRIFAEAAAAAIGFDFAAGRLDTTVHPFCSGIGPGDCRITTRYASHEFNQAFFGVLHEAGHGIYEQGLDAACAGLPLGQAVSLGIHESQSRLWENQVGRSQAFWEHFYPRLKQTFPGVVDDVPLEDFVFAINDVSPSFIRVEADEATYNLHIILRFELEQMLIAGEIDAKDVPSTWNAAFHAILGLTPPSNAKGCLQDIHWSMGGLGYFPTYTLGNLYAAQFMEAARRDLGDLDADFRRGEFLPLKTWLNEHIHRHGQRYRPEVLARTATGRPVHAEPFLRYLSRKFSELYGVDV